MKYFIALLLIINIKLNAQTGNWIWLRGSNINDAEGHYGTKGVTDSLDDPSGTWQPVFWTDLNGNFWLFGGIRTEPGFGYTSDMWKYDPLINQWTWMHGDNSTNGQGVYGTKGVSSPLNIPPARSYGSASWVDSQNNLWMYGGVKDIGPGSLDDLWKYNTTTNEWTWMNGSNSTNAIPVYGTLGIPDPLNTPGQRAENMASWSDSSDNLYFFGGETSNSGQNSDMWRYSISTNQWTWIKGPQTSYDQGYFGIRGVESPLNNPPARYVFAKWKDLNGNFWLFGGESGGDEVNDMWRYNPVTNNWTWMNGDSVGLSPGIYGTKCTAGQLNTPNARSFSSTTWIDSRGNLWLYSGGFGFSTVDGTNDLWMYCISTNEWKWITGDSVINTPGSWGTPGVSSPSNTPGPRGCAASWSDNNGDLYLFGGTGPGFIYPYNDMWKFVIDTNCASCAMTTSIQNIKDDAEINIYPNPATDYLIINTLSNDPLEFELYTFKGEKLSFESSKISDNNYKIKLEGLAPDVYFLKFNSKKGYGYKKLLIK